MKKKIILCLAMVFAFICMCTGCNSVAKEKEIKEDLEQYTQENFLREGEKIDKVVIEKRITKKKEKSDQVWCTVTSKDLNAAYEKKVILIYHLYNSDGWILDEIYDDPSGEEIIKPLVGVDEEKITNSLVGESLTVEDESWNIEEGEIKSVKIKKEQTDLEKGTENLTAEIEVASDVETVNATVELGYEFDKEWELKSVKEKGTAKTKENAETALKTDDESIISLLDGQTISILPYKEDDGVHVYSSSDIQEVIIAKDEISDLKIESQKKSNKGENQNIVCSFVWNKAKAVFQVTAEIAYYYEGEWQKNVNSLKPELKSIDNMMGVWNGTYNGAPYSGTAELNITSIDGTTITGVYSYTPEKIDRYSHAGNYSVSGTIDTSTLIMKLKAGDWVEKPDKPLSTEKIDITATYRINDDEIRGVGQEDNPFKVKKQ